MKALERLNSGDIQTYDMQAVVREIRALRAELKMGSHPLVKAAIKTAKYTETSVRRQTA